MGLLDSAGDMLKSAMSSLAGNAAKPEDREPGVGDVGPSVNNKPGLELVTQPMSADEVGEWWERIEAARQRIKAREGVWDILLKAYLPAVSAPGQAEDIKANSHFRNVQTKIGQLFFTNPDLVLTSDDMSPAANTKPNPMQAMAPVDPMTGQQQKLPDLTMEDVVIVKQAVLKKKMGRDGMKTGRLMDELLFDVLGWAGIGAAKVGYQCVFKTLPQPRMVPAQAAQSTNPMMPAAPPPVDPTTGQPQMVPAMDPMTGQPIVDQVPVPVYEDWYARRMSPKKVLWDADLSSTRFDEDATWMGMEFFLSPKMAKSMLGMTDEEVGNASAEDDRKFKYTEDAQTGGKGKLVHCVEIYCRSCRFTEEVHPLALHQLILVEGIKDKAFVWRPSPDQTFDDKGKLTPDSVESFPYRILTIRDLADSPYPPSDAAFTNNLVKEMNTHRRQMVKIRDAAIGRYFYDIGALEEGDLDAIRNAEPGDYIGLSTGAMKDGIEKVIALVAQVHSAPDDWRTAEQLKQDMNETLGISANAAGASEDTVRTATEISTMQSAMATRNQKEQSRAVDFWLDLARITDQLLMRYATEDQYITIAGEEGASIIQMWNSEIISGKYLYDIAPDSNNHIDTNTDFHDLLELYNLAAPDPLFNRKYVLRSLARMKGRDPNKVVLSQDAVATMAQPPHGGTSGAGDVVNKHQATTSGKMPNAPGAANKREGGAQ